MACDLGYFQDIEFILEIPVLIPVLTLNSSDLKEYMLNADVQSSLPIGRT